jgi:hypothetical protein
MARVNCTSTDDIECLDALIQEINEELSIACQIPFTVPKKELARIIDRAKDYFYKIYEDSVEETYIALPASTWQTYDFNRGIMDSNTTLNNDNINSNRGVVPMPSRVYSVVNAFEISGFGGEDGGFGSRSFSAGDPDLSIDKFIFSSQFGAGIGAENLMYYVINSKYVDNARQVLQAQISYSYNRLTNKFRFLGELPTHSVIFQIYAKIPDCALFQDEAFIRYCTAKAKIQLSRILGTFNYNLPGNITINYDMIREEGTSEIEKIEEQIKGDEGVDYFFTG